MCMKTASAGEEDFRSLIENNIYYIDKTAFIKELVEKRLKVSLITRPRRFGKTLNMFMLKEFFDITKESNDIFSGLEISKDKEFCNNWMNKYPVIHISMNKLKSETFEGFLNRFNELALRQIEEHNYLLTSPNVLDSTKQTLEAIKNRSCNKAQLEDFLLTLCRALHQHWEKKVIVLIDEYDAPLSNIKKGHDHDKLITFIGNLLETGLKANSTLNFSLMTGCLRIAKESIYTGLNHINCYGVGDVRFADKFGFTPEEVDKLLSDMHLSHKKKEIQEWYDGYCFGKNQKIYCPWDVMKYIEDLEASPDSVPQTYWLNTSNNNVVREFIGRTVLNIDEEVTTLLQGGSIKTKIINSLTYDAVDSSMENVWTLLYLTGYLTKTAGMQPGTDRTIELHIPNQEIKEIFNDSINSWISDTFKKMDLSQLFASFWNCDEKVLTDSLSKIILSNTSCFDACKEYFYHAYLDCLFTTYSYTTLSNYESGHGFADIIVKDNTNYRAAVIEIKRTKNINELATLPDIALNQIITNKYDTQLDDADNYSTILHWGIAFCQKHCLAKGIRVK